jgi:hypothetical protein
MPDWIAEGCSEYGIRFVELTLALESERRGELVYNPLYDIHLNARGSALGGGSWPGHWRTGQSLPGTRTLPDPQKSVLRSFLTCVVFSPSVRWLVFSKAW